MMANRTSRHRAANAAGSVVPMVGASSVIKMFFLQSVARQFSYIKKKRSCSLRIAKLLLAVVASPCGDEIAAG
jgi:hypothetical protein